MEVLETKGISDRIAIFTIQKREVWTSSPNKDNPLQKKLYQIRKSRNRLTIINCYAPHMGITSSKEEVT